MSSLEAPGEAMPLTAADTSAIDLSSLCRELHAVTAIPHSRGRSEALTALIRRLTNAQACLYLESSQATVSGGHARVLAQVAQSGEIPDSSREPIAALAGTVCGTSRLETIAMTGSVPTVAMGAPVLSEDGGAHGALVLVLQLGRTDRETFATILQMAAALLSDAKPAPSPRSWSVADVAEIVDKVGQAGDLDEASLAVAEAVRRRVGAARAAVGLRMSGTGAVQLRALSGVVEIDARAELVRTVVGALAAVVRAGETVRWPGDPRETVHQEAGESLNKANRALGLSRALAFPLRTGDGIAFGAVALFFEDQLPGATSSEVSWEPLDQVLRVLGVALDGRRQSRAKMGVFRTAGGRSGRRRLAWAALGLALLVGVLLVPVDHELTAPVELQAAQRRFVAAPFDALLEESRVRPGDEISIGDRLAVLDGREIELELTQLRAERAKVLKQRDVSLAAGDSASTQITQLEVARIDARIDLLEGRHAQLNILSPVDGIVIQGDLAREAGSPVGIGQRLFELAPLDSVIAEIYLPAKEIAFYRDRQLARVTLPGFGARHWEGALEHIHPRAVVKDGRNSFVAELPITNSDKALRPGMRGEARIQAGKRSLGWVLFHEALEWLATRLA